MARRRFRKNWSWAWGPETPTEWTGALIFLLGGVLLSKYYLDQSLKCIASGPGICGTHRQILKSLWDAKQEGRPAAYDSAVQRWDYDCCGPLPDFSKEP